jgi:transcriptional regulator with XRE-family HTH domain
MIIFVSVDLKVMAKTIDKVYEEITKRIVKERKRQGITQERLAALSDIDRTHMGLIEQGRRRPTLSTLHKIARTLKLTLEQLFKGF